MHPVDEKTIHLSPELIPFLVDMDKSNAVEREVSLNPYDQKHLKSEEQDVYLPTDTSPGS